MSEFQKTETSAELATCSDCGADFPYGLQAVAVESGFVCRKCWGARNGYHAELPKDLTTMDPDEVSLADILVAIAENPQAFTDEGKRRHLRNAAKALRSAKQSEGSPSEIGECEHWDGIGVCRHIALCPEGSRLLEDWRKRYLAEQANDDA